MKPSILKRLAEKCASENGEVSRPKEMPVFEVIKLYFVLYVGRKKLVKRKQFEQFIEKKTEI